MPLSIINLDEFATADSTYTLPGIGDLLNDTSYVPLSNVIGLPYFAEFDEPTKTFTFHVPYPTTGSGPYTITY